MPGAARHSPMRLKLSDKVLRNFFILPIFSAGCGSMRSHIWATRGSGNFPKLVQSGAQTTARARGKKAVPPPPPPLPPPPPPPARRRRAGLGRRVASCRLRSGLGRGWAGGGVLRGAGGGRHRRRRGSPVPRRRPAHFPSFVTESGAAGGRQWGRRGRRRGGAGRAGNEVREPGVAECTGTGGEKFSAPSFGHSGERGAARNRHPPRPHRPSRRLRPAFPGQRTPGAGPQRDLGSRARSRVLFGPVSRARAPAAPPPGRPRAPLPARPAPPRPRAPRPGPAEGLEQAGLGTGRDGDSVSRCGEATQREGSGSRSFI